MEYTVQALANLAGVSARTLRFYDQIGLLKPVRVSSSGYRIYGEEQVDTLQQILFYRELDMELQDIKALIHAKDFDRARALEGHLRALCAKRARLDALIDTVTRTIESQREGKRMSDQQKFEGFKQKLIDENERKYGKEAREKYGNQAVEESNRKMLNLTQEQYDAMTETATRMQALIEQSVRSGADPKGEEGQKVARLHKQWLCYTWPAYSAEAHKGLTQMYLDDERFTAHYDKDLAGCARFLRDAVHAHAE